MIKVNVLNLAWSTVLLRFYLMMAVTLIGGFSGYWAIALLALPIFLSAILGIEFSFKTNVAKENKTTRTLKIEKQYQSAA